MSVDAAPGLRLDGRAGLARGASTPSPATRGAAWSSRPAPARARPGCWCRASCARCSTARSRTRSSRSPSPARRPARCASAWPSGCANSPQRAATRTRASRRFASAASAPREAQRARAGAGGAARARARRRPVGRDPHLPRLVRPAAARRAARAARRARPAARHGADRGRRRARGRGLRGASMPPCCADAGLRADYRRAWCARAAAPAAQVARRGLGAAHRDRARRRGRHARRQRRCRPRRRCGRRSTDFDHPAAAPARDRRVRARSAALAQRSARTGRVPQQGACAGVGARAGRSTRERFAASRDGAAHEERRRRARRSSAPALARRVRRCSSDMRRACRRSTRRTTSTCAWSRLARALLAEFAALQARARPGRHGRPRALSRWRCCATRRSPAGCRSGSMRACATC